MVRQGKVGGASGGRSARVEACKMRQQDHAPEVAIACVSELGVLAWACGAVGGNDPPKMEMAMLPGSKWSVHQEHSGDVDELSGWNDHRTREGGSTSRVLLSFACAPKKSSSQKSNCFLALPKKQTWEYPQYHIAVDVSRLGC